MACRNNFHLMRRLARLLWMPSKLSLALQRRSAPLIKGGGARYGTATGEDVVLGADDFADGKCQLSAGKKRHALIILA